MKLSFTTLGCPDWDFEHIVEEAGKLGFKALEIRGVNGIMRAEEIPQFFPENIEKTRELLQSHGLKLCGFGASANFHTEEKAQAGLEEGRKAVDVCAAAGIPMVRVFGDQLPDKENVSETIGLVGRSIAELCGYAEGKGVDILLEIHGEFNTIEAVSGVIDACRGYQCFGILWDIEHSDRAYGDEWFPFYQVIRPYIRHTHIKDYIRNDDGTFTLCLPGEGDIPIGKIVSTLKQDGYDGYYSLEWEKKWHPELPDPDVALPVYRDLMRRLDQEA